MFSYLRYLQYSQYQFLYSYSSLFFGKILILYQHLTIYSILIIIHPTKAE